MFLVYTTLHGSEHHSMALKFLFAGVMLNVVFSLWSINHLHCFCEPANAWEEGDEIVLYSCRMAKINLAMVMEEVTPGNYANPHL